jgi:formylglycine-generating enzyme required for sulfatase activity
MAEDRFMTRRPEPLGNNYLFVIGIDNYPNCPPLNNCVKDAKDVIQVLQQQYNFEAGYTKTLFNDDATRRNILFELDSYSEKVDKNDNLIIYFSGHGEKRKDIGYWVPFKAQPKFTADFITAHDITSRLNGVDSLHTLLIVDACFSGSIFLQHKSVSQLKEYTKRSRLGWSSSHSRETALDGQAGDNSPFAACLIEELRKNTNPLSVAQLAEFVKRGMENKTKQLPVFNHIDVKGDDLGTFVFYPKDDEESDWQTALRANTLSAFSSYRKKYPQSAYYPMALEKMKILEEQAFWDKVPKNRQYALNQFIDENPQSPFIPEAQRLLAILEEAAYVAPEPKLLIPDHLALIKGGTFEMGDVMGDKEHHNETVHTVTVSDFLLAKHQLTFEEYDVFCKKWGKEPPSDAGWRRGQRPVINVSWYDAIEYCNWRSEEEGLDPVFDIKGKKITPNWKAKGYRLPTEAEWEYAAREGGKKVRFGNGKNIANPQEINFNGSQAHKKPYSEVGAYREKTVPVGSLKCSNDLGLHDMSGNVWEWCWDWYGDNHNGPSTNPQGPDIGSVRVIRGGSWVDYPANVRVAYRGVSTPVNRYYILGFRLARAAVAL